MTSQTIMKRCPECSFIYPHNDEHCDFDGAALTSFDEADIETDKSPQAFSVQIKKNRFNQTWTLSLIVMVASITILASVVLVKLRRQSRSERTIAVTEQHGPESPLVQPTPAIVVTDLPVTLPSPSPGATRISVPTPKPSTVKKSGPTISSSPVSTSNAEQVKHPATIRLSSGATIEADEVWRTRDGIWYRRNGMVTLLKSSEVRAINRK